ncbi:carboxypeptidase regulatory-like domain-containing protein [Lujinxingia sediminis]|uniref:Carboxypeptidase regulatory-like domain-containing protein n=1 Tax=Lujinxingia sediminis TaxID=2480984 RepID=A0ABY0CN19_9DELT|nr:carboxypeptidase-like regulatory domain-containing protein [Lujinxingia sediminis]RVU40724.1 carboxypeptidase regulatory-like domain-containing protein [Lujinxingia sediminis]
MMSPLSKRLSLMMLVGALAGGPVACSDTTDEHPNTEVPDAGEPDAELDADPDPDVDPDGGEQVETRALPLSLKVQDEVGMPIAGASVIYQGQAHLTDLGGQVLIEPAAGAETMIVQIEAEGYAPSSAERPVVEAAEGQQMSALVRLLALGEALSFDAEAPATLEVRGVRINLPANALVDGEGNPVVGQAEMTFAGIEPSSDDLRFMPGPLIGVPTEGDPVDLLSVYMADITFWQNGEKLQLAEGIEADLEFPISEAFSGYAAGDTIPFWSFDLEQARWIYESECEVVAGDRLVASCQAGHFSWWNVDKPLETRNCVEVTVIDSESGEPIPGATIEGEAQNYLGRVAPFGATDAQGKTCVDFMRAGTIELSALHSYYYQDADGPLTVVGNTTAANCQSEEGGECHQITIEMSNARSCLSGTVVDENAAPVAGAPVYGLYEMTTGPGSVIAESGADGTYCLDLPPVDEVELLSVHEGTAAQAIISLDPDAFTEAVCGSEGCEDAGELVLESGATTCVEGSLNSYTTQDNEYVGVPRADQPVYIYLGEVHRTCGPGINPEDRGQILAQGITDADGGFALDLPLMTDVQVTVVIGECHEQFGAECLAFGNQGSGSVIFELQGIETSVEDGGCQALGEFSTPPMCYQD